MAPPRTAGFHHEAFFYADSDEFLSRAIPFLREGVEAGETVLAVLPEARRKLLQEELGAAAEEIEFRPMEELGRNPARLISAWQEILAARDPDRGIRGLGEPAFAGRSAPELDECELHERLVNLAFGEEPGLTVLCPYDTSALEDEVLIGAERSHPLCSDADGSAPSAWFSLDSLLEGPLPPPGQPAVFLSFGKADLRMVRHVISQCARTAGLDTRRNEDLVLSACEVATNSIQHGGGKGALHVWDEDGTLVCAIRDAGQIADPLVGRELPESTRAHGRGLWIANQLCDLVQIRSGDFGTEVRLRMTGVAL